MRKFILKVGLFIVLFFLINILYLILIQKFDWNFSKRIEAINLKNPAYENIILGNSYAMDGIDSKLLSNNTTNTYNLAIGGAGLNTNYIQLSEYLKIAHVKPKRVVLGVGSHQENFFKKNKLHPIVEFTALNYNYTLNDLPVAKFKWIFIELVKKIISSEHRNAELVQGQLRVTRTVADKTKKAKTTNTIPFSAYENSEDLKQITELCKQNGIELLLIEMPGFRNTRNNKAIGPYEIDYQHSNKVKLYNFNGPAIDTVFDSNDDWLGDSHLNKKGAKKFTEYLKNYLIL